MVKKMTQLREQMSLFDILSEAPLTTNKLGKVTRNEAYSKYRDDEYDMNNSHVIYM